jgi:hypothetical protein
VTTKFTPRAQTGTLQSRSPTCIGPLTEQPEIRAGWPGDTAIRTSPTEVSVAGNNYFKLVATEWELRMPLVRVGMNDALPTVLPAIDKLLLWLRHERHTMAADATDYRPTAS